MLKDTRANVIYLYLLPFKGRGGQSALRFARLRMEKRHNYVRKVAETAVQLFISGDKVNVAGLVLAGSADFKTELSQSDMFDQVSRSNLMMVANFTSSYKCIILLIVVWITVSVAISKSKLLIATEICESWSYICKIENQ